MTAGTSREGLRSGTRTNEPAYPARVRRWPAIAVIGVLLLAACSADQGSSEVTDPAPKDGWLLVANGATDYTFTTLLIGTLEIDLEDRCVGVRQDGDETSIPVIFPDGTTLDETGPQGPAIVLSDGRRLLGGSRVEIPGGYVAATRDFSFPEYEHIVVPEVCSVEGVWIMGDMGLIDLLG